MTKPLLLAAVLLLAPAAVRAASEEHGCSCQLRYDLRLDGQAVELDDGQTHYRLEADRVLRDGQALPLNAAQARTASRYREGLLQLVPAVSEVAVDGAMLGLEAASVSLAALSGDEREARHFQRRSAQLAERIHSRYNGYELLREDADFEAELDDQIEDLAEDMASEMSGGIARLVFTALANPAKLQARSEITGHLISQRIEARAADLERKAQPLCARFAELDGLERELGIDAITVHAARNASGRGVLSF